MSALTLDGTTEPAREIKFSGANRGQGKNHFPCSAGHGQDWQPYPVDPYSAESVDYITLHHHSGGPLVLIFLSCLYFLPPMGDHDDVLIFSLSRKLLFLNCLRYYTPYLYRTYPHTNSGCGKGEAHIIWSARLPE